MPRKKSQLWSKIVAIALLLCIVHILIYRVVPAVRYNVFPHAHPRPAALDVPILLQLDKTHSQPTVNLIIASQARDDTTWTSKLVHQNLSVLRYISDDPSARLHPPLPKGREALMYFTYLHDFYEVLPDISIFIHPDELSWHIEGTLLRNMTFLLNQLDFQQVERRGYFNLRTTWRAACPDWINTTKIHDDWDKQEEPYMREAWAANFGDDPIPDLLGGPCCSQFAVTRDAIRTRPREQYRRSMEWLMQTDLDDRIAGRVWEHMWPWLFTGEASDCKYEERRSLCGMYRICFESDGNLEEYKELWNERERLKEDMSPVRAVWDYRKAAVAWRRMEVVKAAIEQGLSKAWEAGKVRDGFG